MTAINWQQPYVNTFKHFTIASDKNVVKHGDITSQMDSQIKSTVYKIIGSSPASNFITMPKLSGQSLNLTGRYIYFLFKPISNKCFSLHIDIATAEKSIVRISFSNLFKEFKSTTTWIQFPFVIQAPKGSVYEKTELNVKDLSGSAPPITKWTILCVDLIGLIQQYIPNRTFHSVRGYKLCANLLIKNVITSDFLYEPGLTHAEAKLKNCGINAFPRELSYPCEKYDNWYNFYDYVVFPNDSNKTLGQSRVYANNIADEPHTKRTNLNKTSSSTQFQNVISHIQEKSKQFKFTKENLNLPLVGVQQDTLSRQTDLNFVTPDEFEKQNENDIHVYPFKSCHDDEKAASDLDTQENDLVKFQSSLEPDPILKLNKIIGFGADANKMQNVLWSHDSQYLIYTCQALVVAYHVNTNEQWCFVGHADKVGCIALSNDNKLIASGQSGPFSLVRVWDFDSRKCLAIFRNHDHSLYLLEFSHCGNYLCGVGKDKQGKTMVILWDIREITSKQNNGITSSNSVRLVAKAHTDVHINKILFVTYDSSRLVSCGRDNVRFWRLKDDTLRSCSVNLSPYIQALNSTNDPLKISLDFTDICMNTRMNAQNENLVYACTRTGQIFEFNITSMEIANVRVLEPLVNKKTSILSSKEVPLALRLNSLSVTNSFCATGSQDGYVRVWPLDFSQVSVEAEHEAPIGLVRFSPDCFRIATATLNGNLGVLDVKQKEYITLIRSHSDSILDAAIDMESRFIATCSLDGSVRVWDFKTCRQLYDFDAEQEQPTRVGFNPSVSNTFACGFNSGKVRIFNVEQAKLIIEISSPHNKLNEITDLKYSLDGKRLITGDLMKYLCLYDVDRDYSLIRMLPNCISSSGSLTISPDHKHLAVIGSTDYLLTVFEVHNLNEVLRIDIVSSLSKQTDQAIKLTYASHDLNQLICATSTNKLLKFDAKTGRLISSISKIHKTQTDCLLVSNDGRFLITSGDNAIKVWDYEMRLEKNYQTFIGHSSKVNSLLLTSPDNTTLISIGDSIVFWDFLAFRPLDSFSAQMPKGRELENMKNLLLNPVSVVRENTSKKDNKFKSLNDVNKLKILNKNSFEEMKQTSFVNKKLTSKSMSSFSSETEPINSNKLATSASVIDWINLNDNNNISFEKPRTPPIATEIHIETVGVNADIEDTFLNDEFTLLDSNLSANSSGKKFFNLPNFVNGDAIFDQYLSPSDEIDHELKQSKQPNVVKHLNIRKKTSIAASKRYMAPNDKCGLKLNSVIGYNGKHATQNMIWSPEREFFAFSIGSIICTEDLKTGKQKILYDHQEDVTVLTLRNDNSQMASASAYFLQTKSNTSHTKSIQSQITIWSCDTFEIFINLFHKNSSNITCMNYSSDDRFLISIGDYKTPSLIIWNTYDYSCLVSMDNLNHVIHDIAWNPNKCNEFVMCGQNKMLIIWSLDEKPMRTGSLRSFECDIPLAICEKKDDFDFTSLAYSDEYLFAATSFGLITVWQTKTNICFLNWQADTNEIDYLCCLKQRLITGSSKGAIKLWNISSIQNKSNLRQDGILIENELQVNGAVKYCKFDLSCEVGIVATNKNTLFYLNWIEESSVRLVSSHMNKINSICCINDKYLSTASDDGSLNIWSLSDRERIVQFEVKSVSATCQSLLVFENNKHLQKLIKYIKTANNKTPFIIVGYSDGSLRIFDIDRKCIISKLKPLADEITRVNYCKNTSIVLAGSIEGLIAVIDLNQGSTTRIINDHKLAPITSLESVHSNLKQTTYWLAASKDKRISIWSSKLNEDLFQILDWLTFSSDLAAPKEILNDKLAKKNYWNKQQNTLAYFTQIQNENSLPDTIVYIGHEIKKQIMFYNFIKKQMLRTMDLTEWPECMCISPRSNLIAFGTSTRLLQIKDYNRGTFQDYAQHSDNVAGVCFSNDGKRLFTTSFNEIFIWDVLV